MFLDERYMSWARLYSSRAWFLPWVFSEGSEAIKAIGIPLKKLVWTERHQSLGSLKSFGRQKTIIEYLQLLVQDVFFWLAVHLKRPTLIASYVVCNSDVLQANKTRKEDIPSLQRGLWLTKSIIKSPYFDRQWFNDQNRNKAWCYGFLTPSSFLGG